jgi:phosphate-selective porin OprO/OprP
MKRILCWLILFLLSLPVWMERTAHADGHAMEQLLRILEKKALLSADEMESIRQAVARDEEHLRKRRAEVEAREKALIGREEELREREEAVGLRGVEAASSAASTAPCAKVDISKTDAAGAEVSNKDSSGTRQKETGFPLMVTYENGFRLTTRDEDTFSLRIGGLLQSDYRYLDYSEEDPHKNEFDLRRVRLLLSGNLTSRFDYKFEYEFQGAGSRHLLDAYGDVHVFPFGSIRGGQFKEPFSLEQSTKDCDLFFAERSMGYYLTPQRDVGVMAHGAFWNDRLDYGVGVFNGDGLDDSTSGDVDDPELTGRLVFSPFKNRGIPALDDLQVGGSFSHARIDRTNVDIEVKTTGLTTFFDVASSAKFNIIREAKDRTRQGAEVGWAYGPVLFMGEYFHEAFRDIQTSSSQFDTTLKDYYVAVLWMVTGEHPTFRDGILQPIRPLRCLWKDGWGGLGIALRYDSFEADESVYENLINEGNSVREAEAYTIALNWYLNDFARLVVDYTRTDFDRPLLVGRDALEGTSIFSDREDVLTTRFQLAF